MSGFYPAPNPYFEDVFNPNDYKTFEEIASETNQIDLSNCVKKTGDVMNGLLLVPEINTNKITFFDNSVQENAFTSEMYNDVIQMQNTTSDISYDETNSQTVITNTLLLDTLKFVNNNTDEQTSPFTETNKTEINNNKIKLTDIAYNQGLLKTTINNSCYINNLTCGNINTSHLANTDANIQAQISGIHQKTYYMSSSLISNETVIDGKLLTDEIKLNFDLFFGDNTVQMTAFSESKNELLNTVNTKTQNQTASWGETEFVGNMRLTNLFFSSNPNQYQDVAFTSLEKTKLSWLNIDATELFINQIKYLDNSIQTTAFTSTDKTKLSDLAINTQNITSLGSFTEINGFLNCHNTIFLEDQVKITFFNQDQNYAYTNADRNKLQSLTINNGLIPSNKIGTGIISDSEFNSLNNCTYNIQNALSSLNIPKMSQTFTLNSNLILQNGNTIFPTNTDYDNNVTIDMRTLSGFDSQWQNNGIMNNNNEFIKLGVYLINVRASVLNLKWYKKFLLKFFDVYYPNYNDGSIPQGIQLNSSSSDELNKYFTATLVMRVTNTQYTYFNLRFEYWFATALSGNSQLDMEIQITEL